MSPEDQFRECLGRLSADPAAFLASPVIHGFLELIRRELTPTVLRVAAGWGCPYSGVDDATNMILVSLLDNPESGALIVSRAADPFSYARKCVLDWVGIDTGRSHFMWNGDRQRVHLVAIPQDEISVPDQLRTFDSLDPWDDELTIGSAVARTVAVIKPRTPVGLAPVLPDLVSWLAENPPARGTESATVARASLAFPMLPRPALKEVALISWGRRPDMAGTSLLGGFLRAVGFNPFTSPTHFRALRFYQDRLRSMELVPVR